MQQDGDVLAIKAPTPPGDGAEPVPTAPPFYRDSLAKFCLLSIATLGLYQAYWFYKSWSLIRDRTESDVQPLGRALFSPVFCYSFVSRVDAEAERLGVPARTWPGGVTVAFGLLVAAQGLPDPWWLLGLFSFAALVPVVRQIESLHAAYGPAGDPRARWSAGSIAVLAVGGLFASLGFLVALGPPTRVLPGAELPLSYTTTLQHAGVLDDGERIEWFYSAGLFSILEDGNVLTDRRVVSYETLNGELNVYGAAFDEIAGLQPDYAISEFDLSVVTVTTLAGEQFLLLLSCEERGDRAFVEALSARVVDRTSGAAGVRENQ